MGGRRGADVTASGAGRGALPVSLRARAELGVRSVGDPVCVMGMLAITCLRDLVGETRAIVMESA